MRQRHAVKRLLWPSLHHSVAAFSVHTANMPPRMLRALLSGCLLSRRRHRRTPCWCRCYQLKGLEKYTPNALDQPTEQPRHSTHPLTSLVIFADKSLQLAKNTVVSIALQTQ